MRNASRTGICAICALGAVALAQPPFERRPPQEPLERPVVVETRIEADSRWKCSFGLSQTITTQAQTEDWADDGPLETTLLVQNATLALEVVTLDQETGVATIEARFQRLLVVSGEGDTQREFRWDADDANPEPEHDTDALLTALAGSVITARVSRRGAVRGVTGYEDVREIIENRPGADPAAMGLFGPASIGQSLQMIWRPAGVAGAERNIGDSWPHERRAGLGAIGGFGVRQDMRVERIEDGILKARGTVEIHPLPPAEPPSPDVPEVELIHTDGRVLVEWDIEQGCTKSASERLDVGAKWSFGPARLGLTLRSERSVSLAAPPTERRGPGQG